MRISSIYIQGIRCFDHLGPLHLSPRCNIIVGKNNSGKSTLLRAVLSLQGFPFSSRDARRHFPNSSAIVVHVAGIAADFPVNLVRSNPPVESFSVRMLFTQKGSAPNADGHLNPNEGLFHKVRPFNGIVPFIAKRKAMNFDHNVSLNPQSEVTGTHNSLFARVDSLATAGHPDHEAFIEAVKEIVGLVITTRASGSGKEAGYYYDRDTFVGIEQMGDGVTEMVAMIVELCLEKNKIFVLEEPESNLHPEALKALLKLIVKAAEHNQFIVATHSNIVLKMLGADIDSKIFRVFREQTSPTAPSSVEEVANSPEAHTDLLRELGYDFADIGLYDAWLFLEESSAERIFRDILIPQFVPKLLGRIRTYSAGGASKLEPSVEEFQKVMVFVHLTPVYEGRMFIRADGDQPGKDVVEKLRRLFPSLSHNQLGTFSHQQFEYFYPAHFASKVQSVLAIKDQKQKRAGKKALLEEVLEWTRANGDLAHVAWKESCKELIELLELIQSKIPK